MLGQLESHRESLQVQPPLLVALSFYKSSAVTRGWLPVLAVNILVVEGTQLFGCFVVIASVNSNCSVEGLTDYRIGSRGMSLLPWNEGSDSDHATGLNLDSRFSWP